MSRKLSKKWLAFLARSWRRLVFPFPSMTLALKSRSPLLHRRHCPLLQKSKSHSCHLPIKSLSCRALLSQRLKKHLPRRHLRRPRKHHLRRRRLHQCRALLFHLLKRLPRKQRRLQRSRLHLNLRPHPWNSLNYPFPR